MYAFCRSLFIYVSGNGIARLPGVRALGYVNISLFHGGESHDILYLYSDRTGKNIRQYFFNTQCIFIR